VAVVANSMSETEITIQQPDQALRLLGARDRYLRAIRDCFSVDITHRRGRIRIRGEEDAVAQAAEVFQRMRKMLERRGELEPQDVQRLLTQVAGEEAAPRVGRIDVFDPSRKIEPRTPGQAAYVEAIRKYALTFAYGPAGTGKTYLAVAVAVEALKREQVRKIVLCRPAVEAGESLGFLPGDLQAKINPYLRPLLDALHEMIDYEQIKRLMEQDVIEVIPLAYMRGRTLNEAFIILDEAQNATISQMKMFLTRMGEQSKIVVSGDTTQIDLPRDRQSGLVDAMHRLRGVTGICQVELSDRDIVRHRLVQEIVRAYESTGARGGRRSGKRSGEG